MWLLYFFCIANPFEIGAESLLVRELLRSLGIVAGLVSVYSWSSVFLKKPFSYLEVVCLPAVAPIFIYYLLIMPSQVGEGFTA
ncbi:MAG TPA: hypothetical protein DCL66_04250 [Gammaproteobacteria bacterium]|nr:hypothetical protein [Gammaproteobacteria bacterium]